MPFRSILILVILLIGLLLSMSFLGMQTTQYLAAILFILKAIIFSHKPHLYDKFLEFINPRLYNVYMGKGSEFIRKNRITNIIGFYLASVIFFINANLAKENNYLPVKFLGLIGSLSLILLAIGYFFNLAILKRSSTNGQYLTWSIVFGFGVSLLIVIGILVYFFSMAP